MPKIRANNIGLAFLGAAIRHQYAILCAHSQKPKTELA